MGEAVLRLLLQGLGVRIVGVETEGLTQERETALGIVVLNELGSSRAHEAGGLAARRSFLTLALELRFDFRLQSPGARVVRLEGQDSIGALARSGESARLEPRIAFAKKLVDPRPLPSGIFLGEPG
jgi:hypothetical protein